MEGKTVILSVVIMTLVMAQIQVEATVCCPSKSAEDCYLQCILTKFQYLCPDLCECTVVSGDCPPRYPYDSLKKTAQGNAVNEYCKLGCGFSLCGAMTTLQNSDANEIATGAVEQCTKVCSTLCNKGSLTAVEST
uniref:Thionin-2.2 n=1 Tax=Noccaea caerulescens TaxID=107243 RepID=A0A1J3CNX9_NOCCA